jgi:hypothetical protein
MSKLLETFLNEPAEIHAAAVGIAACGLFLLTGRIEVLVGVWAIAFGTRKVAGHLADVRHEFAYTVGGFAFTYLSWYCWTLLG